MIKILVEKRNNAYTGFASKGHAGYAEYGHDIVCAAVSALIITTVNALEKFTPDKFRVKESDGNVLLRFAEPTGEKATLLMDTLVLGLTDIQNSYNKRFLTIKVKEVEQQ